MTVELSIPPPPPPPISFGLQNDGTMAARERVSLRTGLASTDLDLPLL